MNSSFQSTKSTLQFNSPNFCFVLLFACLFFTFASAYGRYSVSHSPNPPDPIWNADFNSITSANDNPIEDWTTSITNGTFIIDSTTAKTVLKFNGLTHPTGGTATWFSAIKDISNYSNVSISIEGGNLNPNGNNKEASDNINFYYKIGSGSWVNFGSKSDDYNAPVTYTVDNLNGTTLQIKVDFQVSTDSEDYYIDSASFTGTYNGPSDTQAPDIPSISSFSNVTNSSIQVNWTAVADNPSSGASGINHYEIEVNGNGATNVFNTGNNTTYNAQGLAQNTSYSFRLRAIDNSNNTSSWSSSSSQSTTNSSGGGSTSSPWLTNGSNLYFNTGDIGLGTNTPQSKLHVVNSQSISSTWNPSASSLRLEQGGASLIMDSNEIYSSSTIHLGSTDSNYLLKLRSISSSGNPASEKMVVKTNGYVGIGTSNPDSPLAVAGKIHAQEVLVDMIGWSDFVFESNYDLPTLQEVKLFIEQYGHLPQVPSAEEVVENGIELGEMNKILLQKIEELTLYILQLEERINKLEK